MLNRRQMIRGVGLAITFDTIKVSDSTNDETNLGVKPTHMAAGHIGFYNKELGIDTNMVEISYASGAWAATLGEI